ncbi:MAG: hypothetical protein R3Y46_02035 [Opitutales bacterium]
MKNLNISKKIIYILTIALSLSLFACKPCNKDCKDTHCEDNKTCQVPQNDYDLGLAYLNGTGVEQNDAKAFETMQKEAQAGNLEALYMLGIFHVTARGTAKNDTEAFNCFKSAVEQGHARSLPNLLRCYTQGIGTDINLKAAFDITEKVAQSGDENAQISLASCYLNAIGVEKDEPKGFALAQDFAQNGNKQALLLVADCYFYGTGVEKNQEEALKYLEKTAKADLNATWATLAKFAKTIDTKLAQSNIFNLLKEKAKTNNNAKSALASIYLNGYALEKNQEEAFKLYKELADAGERSAKFVLSNLYANGIGTEKNQEKAQQIFLELQ